MRELTVTIKYGKGYDESWAVFKGAPGEVRQDIIDYFGLPSESVAAAMTLHQLVNMVTGIAHGTATAAAQLGAVSLPNGPSASPAPATPSAPDAPAGDPWANVDSAAPAATPTAPASKPEPNPILGLIESTTTVDDLKKLWATNQAAFADEAVMAAWKAKGRALKSAA